MAMSDSFTEETLHEAKQYGREQLRCTLAGLLLDLVLLLLITFWLAQPVDAWLSGTLGLANRWLRLAVFFLLLVLGNLMASFPLSWYGGFVLEHKYKLSRQTLARWLGRYGLQHLLATLLGLLLVEGLFVTIVWADRFWWLVAALAVFAVTVVLGQLAPVLILPLFYKIERLEEGELAARFERLASGTGLKIEGIYRMHLSRETAKANAMLAGLGRTRRVILGDTLLDRFGADEIEVVLAHEIGHHVYRHILKMVAAGFVYSLVTFVVCDWMLASWAAANEAPLDYQQLPVAYLPLILLVTSLCSTILGPLQNAISRHYERQCDRYALDRTGLDAAYRSAFSKLATLNKTDPDPHPWEVFLFHDHPPINERLAMAKE
jgi:STE24 endopeptidase